MTAGSGARAGVAPHNDGADASTQPPKGSASTGVQAAGMRAVAARMVAFYFRAPVKAFFRGRIDYMGYARAINPHIQAEARWSWRMTTPALLAHAVRTEGWSFIPNQVLPPLLANTLYENSDSRFPYCYLHPAASAPFCIPHTCRVSPPSTNRHRSRRSAYIHHRQYPPPLLRAS